MLTNKLFVKRLHFCYDLHFWERCRLYKIILTRWYLDLSNIVPFFFGGELFKRHQNISTFVTTLKINACRNCTTLRKSALRNMFVASSRTWLSFFPMIFWWQRKKGCAMLCEKTNYHNVLAKHASICCHSLHNIGQQWTLVQRHPLQLSSQHELVTLSLNE